MAAPPAIVVACPHIAPPLRRRVIRRERLIPARTRTRAACDDVRRWPATGQQRKWGRNATAGGAHQPHAASSVVAPVAVSDAATPTRSTTLDSCRQKRIRRHNATRDRSHRRHWPSGCRSNQHCVHACQFAVAQFAAAKLADTAGLEDQPTPANRRAQVGHKKCLANLAHTAASADSPKPVVFHPPPSIGTSSIEQPASSIPRNFVHYPPAPRRI
jgi:hypothetical protein